MQELVREELPKVSVALATPEPAQCMENFMDIYESDWTGNMTLEVGGVKLIKDAP
jgi:hypothetical protein